MLRSIITEGVIPGLLLSLYLLVIYLPDVEAIVGYNCTVSCAGTNERCINGICVCAEGFYDSDGTAAGGTCNLKVGLGSNCPQLDACSDANALCNSGKCVCGSGYYDNNGVNVADGNCTAKVGLGSNCPQLDACNDANAMCNSSGKCVCGSGYYDNSGTCAAKVGLGSNCPQLDACSDANALCNSGKCVCGSGYYDNNGVNVADGNCTAKVGLGSNCPQLDACSDANALCNSGKCVCGSGYYDNNGVNVADGTCAAKVGLGSNCPQLDACSDANALCNSGKCVCGSGYYDNNGVNVADGNCTAKVDLGSNCPAVVGEQVCKDPNAACTNGKCTCGSNYYDDNGATSDGTCQLKVDLGSNCVMASSEQVCKDPNAACTNGKCTCSSNYYDDNGATSDGTCQLTTNLRVTPVVNGTITENTITIFWTPPIDRAAVSYYRVEHGPADKSTGFILQNVGNQTSAELNNLDPGKKYSITIFSVNTQTDLNERNTSVTINQTTRPGIPGALVKDMDIDASSGYITLQWKSSMGVVTGYIGSLENTTSFIYSKSFNISGITPSQTFSDLKNGTWYIFTVQAVIGYADTKTLYSDIRRQLIKTRVQVPNPPTNLICLDATDRTISLKWIEPLLPNGDIISYIIVIQRTQPSLESYNVTSQGTNAQYTVDGLTAGSFYTFQVYTRNELYTSTLYAQEMSCATRAQMAAQPEGLLINNVTSRSGTVTWKKLSSLNGTLYGYSLQILNGSSCIREVIWRCTDCQGSFPNLYSSCSDISEQNANSAALQDPQYYEAVALFPDTRYTVAVAAISGLGIGHQARQNLSTKEEAPSKPWNVMVSNEKDKSATIEWNINGSRPGQTTYNITATGISPAETRTHIVSGFLNRKYELIDLEEYWNYSVIVQAITSIGRNQSDSVTFRTLAGPAGPVNNFNVDKGLGDDMYVKARVSWILPDELKRNGLINSFYVQQRENYGNGTLFEVNTTTINRENEDTHIYFVTFDVHPESNYTFMVRAITGNLTGEVNVKNYLAPAGPPETVEKEGINVVPADKVSVRSKTSFRVEINRSFFTSSKNGAIKDQGLICCKDPTCMNDNSTITPFEQMKNMKTYTQAKESGSNKYRLPIMNTTKEQATGRRKRAIDNTYVYDVGIESCDGLSSSQYCNGPLDPGSSYRIIAFVCTSTWCTLSKSYGPFITLSVPSEQDFPVGAVVGGIIGGVVVLTTIIVIILLLRYRSNKGKRARKALDDSNDHSHMENLVKIKKQRPIKLTNFAEYVADYHKDSNLKFSEEYEDLKTLSPQHAHEAADMEENRLKNRFVNILPFDHSRVRLLPIDDVPGSDYINANYLPGFSKTREYIACQGPIPATIDDHWRLIWEQNVRVIVMLTQYKEENRVKCEPYMPLDLKDPKQYGDLVIECLTYSSMNSFEYRTLKIRLGEKERTIKHFHFLSWRDYSANVQFDTMIDFIKKVRSFMQPPDVEGPLIVHCSAGVGRTGTYITIDHVIQHIDKYGPDSTVDIFNFVLKMRENRTTMVQTEQQYIFIHDCIKEYLDRFKTYENQGFIGSEEENLYQNTEAIELYQNVNFNSTQKTEL
ncbi:hypothetical protein CHS0354_001889 [Potamilus streckersoni]|uniref:protein-tyrosine-phosphatase n=1 Tax=Potamilus streckersoni TaxID=2493646 RepID=A0AAE0RLW7_9BIVA|nr:hypothetical protein CHS0354_001889 [Potamilus streckersoni]